MILIIGAEIPSAPVALDVEFPIAERSSSNTIGRNEDHIWFWHSVEFKIFSNSECLQGSESLQTDA